MIHKQSRHRTLGFTAVEFLVLVMVLGVLSAVALPSYFNTVNSRGQTIANENAKALADAIQRRVGNTHNYDTTPSDYAFQMGGSMPVNPCTGGKDDYKIMVTGNSCSVMAVGGSNCGVWTPTIYNVGE